MFQVITQDILSHAVEEVINKFGRVNHAELERMLPLTRQQLRRLQKNGSKLTPNGNLGKIRETEVSQFSDFINTEHLAKGIKNSTVIDDAIRKLGYKGSITSVKRYIRKHLDLVQAPRIFAADTPNRGRRYTRPR